MSATLLRRIDALATEVGRLRRTAAPGYLVDRVTGHVLVIDGIAHLSAGELAREVGVDEALRVVDARELLIRQLVEETA